VSDRKPHLLIVNHFALAPDMGGGTRHIELGRELIRLGWDVTIAASDFHVLERRYLRRSSADDRRVLDESIDGVRMRWFWASAYERNDGRRIANWLSFARSLTRERWTGTAPDVVLGSSPQLFAALGGWRVARRLRVPFVLEIRDLWPESLDVAGTRRGAGYWGLWTLARFLYRSAARIIVLARGVQTYLVHHGIQPERIVYVPNGADVSAFAPPSARSGDGVRVVYAGAHGPANGLDVVLDTAARLRHEKRLQFVLVGDGPAKAGLVERARSAGLTNVTFHDPVPKSQIPALLASCDAGLMVLKDVPLFSFGVSPNKLFDYWGAGLPVVCNVPGEVASWVRESKGGLQTANASAEALEQSLRALVAMSADERRSLGLSGRAWVTREHDRPVLAGRLDAAVRPLVRSTFS
jgi:glycosyltransferase involved in cell wall biosynthesis